MGHYFLDIQYQCQLRYLNLGLNRRDINHIHTCPIRQAQPEIAFGVTRAAIYLINYVRMPHGFYRSTMVCFISLSLFFFLSLSLSLCLYLYLSLSQLFIQLTLSVSPISISIPLFLSLSLYLSVCIYVFFSLCLSICHTTAVHAWIKIHR